MASEEIDIEEVVPGSVMYQATMLGVATGVGESGIGVYAVLRAVNRHGHQVTVALTPEDVEGLGEHMAEAMNTPIEGEGS